MKHSHPYTEGYDAHLELLQSSETCSTGNACDAGPPRSPYVEDLGKYQNWLKGWRDATFESRSPPAVECPRLGYGASLGALTPYRGADVV
jgi:hypothetical protein